MNDEKPIPIDNADQPRRARRSWIVKFNDACRGVKIAVRAEVSFFVHLFVTMIVVLTGAVLGLSRLEWCLIVLCVATVLLEKLARVVTQETHPEIRDVLDIASGAVLLIALGSAIVGVLVLGVHVLEMVAI